MSNLQILVKYSNGIEFQYGREDGMFDRNIRFKIYDVDYTIVWFINQSTLLIGIGKRPACIPFRFMYLDTSFPLVGGNESIGFSYSEEKWGTFGREYPYEVFRIPLEI